MLEGKSDYPTIFELLLRSMNTYRHLNTNATRKEVAQHLFEYLILLYNEHTIGANGFCVWRVSCTK